ncbi:MAG: flagellar protein FlbT [Candidatus Tokpelaia sp. JSC189]|nr:MAG: flagellar protein FlbT [Candidatus Tokpelaia sp. JSC189]
MHLTLRPNEKLYLNGAILQVDRKTRFQLLNNATFLLEAHILQAQDANTPLKQLYFAAQIMLIDPVNADQARRIFLNLHKKLFQIITDTIILDGLRSCIQFLEEGRVFYILKIIRSLFLQEAQILGKLSDDNVGCIKNTTKGMYAYDNDAPHQ